MPDSHRGFVMDRKQLLSIVKYPIAIVLILCFLWLAVRVMSPTETPVSALQWEKKGADFWQFQRHQRRFWHEDAERYCRNLVLDNHYDWRLPTLEELQSLTRISAGRRGNMARVGRAIYWTSTPAADKKRYWAFSFLVEKSAPMAKHNYNSVVCVRTVNRTVLH